MNVLHELTAKFKITREKLALVIKRFGNPVSPILLNLPCSHFLIPHISRYIVHLIYRISRWIFQLDAGKMYFNKYKPKSNPTYILSNRKLGISELTALEVIAILGKCGILRDFLIKSKSPPLRVLKLPL
jgi:hypothetical protein